MHHQELYYGVGRHVFGAQMGHSNRREIYNIGHAREEAIKRVVLHNEPDVYQCIRVILGGRKQHITTISLS